MRCSVLSSIYVLIACVLSASTTLAQSKKIAEKEAPYLSIKHEISRAIERGNSYLKSQQKKDGFWSEEKYPAYTALALTAAVRSP